MNHGIPFERYLSEGSQHSSRVHYPHILQTPYPSAVVPSTSDPGASYHQQSSSTSTFSAPATSQSGTSDSDDLSRATSPPDQRVNDPYEMTMLDDESGQNSDCDIEPDGGVSLAGHEDLMDFDGQASNINFLEGPFEQGSLANVDNPAWPDTTLETALLNTYSSTSWDVYGMSVHPETEDEFGPVDESMSGDMSSQSSSANASGTDGAGPPASSSIETPTPDPHPLYESYPNIIPSPELTQHIDSSGYAVQSTSQATIPGETDETSSDQLSFTAGVDFDPFLNENPIDLQQIQSNSPTNPPHQPPLLLPHGSQERTNLTLAQCLQHWAEGYALQERRHPKSVNISYKFPRFTQEDFLWGNTQRRKGCTVTRSEIDKGKCDFQGVDWKAFRVDRSTVRQVREMTYFNHANVIRSYPRHQMFGALPLYASAQDMNLDARAKVTPMPDNGEYFRFSRMSLQHRICFSHFQLRHLVSASSKNALFFPTASNEDYSLSDSRITNVNPDVVDDSYTIDSAHTDLHCDAIKMQNIFALSAKNDVLVAGGLAGEYAYKYLSSEPLAPFTSGMITHAWSSSTNHVHTYLSRHSGLPQAVFSSNDSHVHTLDLTTNKFVSRHNHVRFVNCSATSPDTRLRVLVRDSIHPMIVEADSGKRIAKLTGHNDYGFACDWAADGVHFATGAQDGLVQIYDMRNWRTPIQTLLAKIGGVRSLAFSPGNGRPVLLAAESADFVHVVDASDGMFAREQRMDFFGEIAGVTFDEGGERFWVGVADPH
ncbi:MAG: hypothetical protein Q9223_007838, partial [Gallowayella weberi]